MSRAQRHLSETCWRRRDAYWLRKWNRARAFEAFPRDKFQRRAPNVLKGPHSDRLARGLSKALERSRLRLNAMMRESFYAAAARARGPRSVFGDVGWPTRFSDKP